MNARDTPLTQLTNGYQTPMGGWIDPKYYSNVPYSSELFI